jgi:hypothetical protein
MECGDDWVRATLEHDATSARTRRGDHELRIATERKGYPVKDVAAAGACKTEEVLVTSRSVRGSR